MNPFIDKLYDEVESSSDESATARASKIRKWILIDCAFIFLLKTDHLLIKRIDIPNIDIQFPDKATLLKWTVVFLLYLLTLFSINLVSVASTELSIRIRSARKQIQEALFNFRIEDIRKRREQLETLKLEISKDIPRGATQKAIRETGLLSQLSNTEKELQELEFQNNYSFGRLHNALVLYLYPQLAIDLVRYALSYVIPLYVLFAI